MGCNNLGNNKNTPKSKFSSSFNENNIVQLDADRIFNITKVLPLETCSNSIINNISQIYFGDDVIYIFDESQQKILCFDIHSGSFVRQIGNQGKGPNDYIYLTCIFFDVHEQLLYAHDLAQHKMFVFEENGNLLETIKTEYGFKSFCKIDSSFWVWSCYEQNNTEGKYNLLELCDKLTDLISKHFPTNNFFDRRDPMYCFSTNDDKIYFVHGYNPQLYQIADGKVLPLYTIENLLRSTSYQELSRITNINEYNSKRFLNSNNYHISSANYTVSNSRIYFTIGLMSSGLSRNVGHAYDYLQDESLYYESISHKNLLLSMIPIAVHKNMVVLTMHPGLMHDQYFPITNLAYNINLSSESNPCLIFAEEKGSLDIINK